MKTIGKKDPLHGKNISTVLMIYVLLLLVLIVFLLGYKTTILFWSGVLALGVLVLERIVALINFKRMPNELITMHREYIEIKQGKEAKLIKYKDIQDITITAKLNRFYILTTYNTKFFIKYLENPKIVKKEILDYKNKYYK